MSGTSSGTFALTAPLSELLIEAYERCQKPMTELTSEKIASGQRSLNLVLYSWSTRGINLWTVQEYTVFMPQGTTQYVAPPQIVDILADSIILRQYLMGSPVAVAPQFTTTINSTSVTISGFSETPDAGQFIAVGVMVSVGGLILDGFYQVDSVSGSGQATIIAAANATASVTNGGAVPEFTSTGGSAVVTVQFADHGLLTGQSFMVEVSTTVGGTTLLGPYAITYVDANSFTITSTYPAGFSQTISENGGDTNLSTQSTAQGLIQASFPEDIQLFPLSRTEYMSIPNKNTHGRVTSVWVNRQISPVMNFWPVFDGNGPYQVIFQASQYVQSADITTGQVLNCPARFLEAFASDLALHLSRKWNPARTESLKIEAAEAWALAADSDIEKVSLFLQPSLDGYFS